MGKKELSFSITMDENALYRFNMYSVYHGLQGIATIFISVLCLAYLIIGWSRLNSGMKLLLIVLGLLYLLVKPISLKLKTKLLMKQEVFTMPLKYLVQDELISVSQGEESAELAWNQIWKIVVRKHDVYVYTGKMNAFIIIKEQAGKNWQKFVTLAENKGCKII